MPSTFPLAEVAHSVLGTADWLVLGLYLAVTFGIGIYAGWRKQTESEYFLAGRSIPPWIAAVSLLATLFSTTSFVGIPGEAYGHGALMFLSSVGYAIVTPLAVWLFLGFFYGRGDLSTIYQYLEQRFDRRVRAMAAVVFVVGRLLWGGTAMYAGATLVSAMTGWGSEWTILAMGLFTVAYTTVGGMRGVLLTDVMQTVVIVLGVVAIGWTLSQLIGHDWQGMWSYASAHGHTFGRLAEPDFYEFSLTERISFWQLLVFYSLLRPLQDYGTDQLAVQRLLSAKSFADAKRAVWIKTIAVLPLMASFYLLGLLMFFYYSQVEPPPASLKNDQVLFHFVVDKLPPPLPGLIAAAALAALMSSISSVISSLATVVSIDLLQPLRVVELHEGAKVRLAKWLAVGWGLAIVALAVGLARLGERAGGFTSSINEISQVVLSLSGVILVVMLAAVLTRWATANGATAALVVGLVVGTITPYQLYFGTPVDERIGFGWVGIPGIIVTAVVLMVVSLVEQARRGRKPAARS